MGFEKFVHTKSRGYAAFASHYPATGNINISAFAVRKYRLAVYTGVVLYYDQSQKKIGIEFTVDQEADGFYPISYRNGSFLISGRSFMKYFGLSSFKQRPFQKVKELFFTITLED